MQQLIENLPAALNVLLYAFTEINREITLAALNRNKERSLARIIITLVVGFLLLYYFYANTGINDFIMKILQGLELSNGMQQVLSTIIKFIAAANIAAYISDVIVKSVCNYLYGDPDFYLTDARANEIITQIREELGQELDARELRAVVEFCRHNYRRRTSNDLGSKPEDWKKTLENLIYYGDIEHFVDQQQALKIKQLELEKKMNIIEDYNDELITYQSQHSIRLQQKKSSRYVSNTKLMSEQDIKSLDLAGTYVASDDSDSRESTPLLQSKHHSIRSQKTHKPVLDPEEQKILYNQTVNQTKKEIQRTNPSPFILEIEEHIPYHCQQYLEHRRSTLSGGIFPEGLTEKLSSAVRRKSKPATSPSSAMQEPTFTQTLTQKLSFGRKPKTSIDLSAMPDDGIFPGNLTQKLSFSRKPRKSSCTPAQPLVEGIFPGDLTHKLSFSRKKAPQAHTISTDSIDKELPYEELARTSPTSPRATARDGIFPSDLTQKLSFSPTKLRKRPEAPTLVIKDYDISLESIPQTTSPQSENSSSSKQASSDVISPSSITNDRRSGIHQPRHSPKNHA